MEQLAAGHSIGENMKGRRYTTARDYLMRVEDLSEVEEGIAVMLIATICVYFSMLT